MKKIITYIVLLMLSTSILPNSIKIEQEILEAKLLDYIANNSQENMDIEIDHIPESVFVQDTIFDVEYSTEILPGKNRGLLKLSGDDWEVKVFWSYIAKVKRTVFTPRRALRPGQKISESDITESVQWTIEKDLPESISEVVGKTARVSIDGGDIIKKRDLNKTYDVTPNNEITAYYSSGSIKLKAKGYALRRAFIGEEISVRVNGKICTAEVVGQNQVVIK